MRICSLIEFEPSCGLERAARPSVSISLDERLRESSLRFRAAPQDSSNNTPVPVEDVVSSDPRVSGAQMAGEKKWPPCMLVEPRDDPADVQAFQKEIWPSIEKANNLLRQDSRVPPSHVAIVTAGSFIRNAKGGVVRKRTVEKHAEKLESLYTATTSN